MTIRPMSEIERLAALIAVEAPVRQHKYSIEARVRWQLVHELRAALEKQGVDWRAIKKRADLIVKDRQNESKT